MRNTKQEDITKTFISRVYNGKLKQIKKDLGSKCSFLSNYIDSKGSRYVRAVVNKKEHLFEVPFDLEQIKAADYEYLQELIQNKCDE